ncbi:hypothetical protein OSB04_003332 [Centaurea solstitialis]|uniref:Uncharacterized protein n=1 Tax=Centaurea solstitialis TaxID=347529 RepID=A0AA38WVN5_9ASTR|nr:hypothetical protein OSB04_003332 [Centaurea solstitialis]
MAIANGVDVIVMAFGHQQRVTYHSNTVASISLSAICKGISMTCTTDNSGPTKSTTTMRPHRFSPWVLSQNLKRIFHQPLIIRQRFPKKLLMFNAKGINNALTALEALTNPAPITKTSASSSLLSFMGTAIVIIVYLMATWDQFRYATFNSAIMPTRCEHAMEVPESVTNLQKSQPGPMMFDYKILGLSKPNPLDER